MIDSKLKCRVANILKESEISRDSDNHLCLIYYTKHIFKRDETQTIMIAECFLKTPFESLSRIRRKVQEENEELRGKLYGVRKDRAKLFKQYFAEN